jgi:hypothetical protein
MYWYKVLQVKLNERVVVFESGLPLRALAPGRHRVWGSRLSEARFVTDALLFEALPEVRAVLPSSWYAEVTLEPRERAVLFKNGRAQVYLRPGTHRYWTVDPSVELRVYAVEQALPELDDDLLRVIPTSDYARRVIEAHERGLLMVKGALRKVLEPGQHASWSYPEAPARIVAVDMRTQQVTLAAQELMTRDKVTLRLSLSAEYAIADAALAATTVSDVRDALYLLVQLAARDYVGSVTLDQLLEGRESMTEYLEAQVLTKAARFGVRVERLGVKDIVLPGEMKALLNRVIEAEKAAAANVIMRREEAAATRLLANSARIMAEQPVLMRLKELETLKDMAERIDEVRIVVGDGGFEKLLPVHLLGASKPP